MIVFLIFWFRVNEWRYVLLLRTPKIMRVKSQRLNGDHYFFFIYWLMTRDHRIISKRAQTNFVDALVLFVIYCVVLFWVRFMRWYPWVNSMPSMTRAMTTILTVSAVVYFYYFVMCFQFDGIVCGTFCFIIVWLFASVVSTMHYRREFRAHLSLCVCVRVCVHTQRRQTLDFILCKQTVPNSLLFQITFYLFFKNISRKRNQILLPSGLVFCFFFSVR